MEWTSQELKDYYNFLDKVYSLSIKHEYPYVLSVTMVPEEFLQQVIDDRWSIDVTVHFCIDWELQRAEYPKSSGLGSGMVKLMLQLQKMVEKPKEIQHKTIYPNLEINKKKYCEGIVKNTND